MRKIILDVDVGTDDAYALLMCLAADAERRIEVIGITCVSGNTTVNNVAINVLRVLQSVNRLDIPVFIGAEKPLIVLREKEENELSQFHGADGFGDVQFPCTPDENLVQQENAVTALHRLAMKHTDVSLVCLAPLTNIALTMKTYPQFSSKLDTIYIMGGNYKGMGNITSAAEFNFFSDPESAHIVLNCAECPIWLVPWETCLRLVIDQNWRLNVLGKINSPQMELLNKAEETILKKSLFPSWVNCDQLAAAVMLDKNCVLKKKSCNASVELHGHCTRGQVVVGHVGGGKENVTIVQEVCTDSLKEFLLWAMRHCCQRVWEIECE